MERNPSQNNLDEEILTKVNKLQEAVWERRPVLRNIMSKHGENTLYNYTRAFIDINPSPLLDARKPELIAVAKEFVSERLGPVVAESVAKQLERFPLVSTTDHHTLIQHPFFLNANIIFGIPFFNNPASEIENLVIFTFAGISLNNASGYARGILFHGQDLIEKMVRLPLLPERSKMNTVYNEPPFRLEDIARAKGLLQEMVADKTVDKNIVDKISEILDGEFCATEILESKNLCEQFTKLNYKLWPKFFKDDIKVPGLIYLEIESLVSELLVRHHLDNQASVLNKLIFLSNYQTLMLELFEGFTGAFSIKDDTGTFLFWGVDDKNHRVRLLLDGDALRSVDGKFVVNFDPTEIKKLLTEKKIFPSMALCYIIVALYYGMKCLGGFSQVHDLTVIKLAWQKLLNLVGGAQENEAVGPVQTKEYGGDGLALAYLGGSEKLIPATGFDLLIGSTLSNFDKFVVASKKLSLKDLMTPMLPEIYAVLFSTLEADSKLLKLTFEQIGQATGLDKKLADLDLAEKNGLN